MRRPILALTVAFVLALGACGDDDGGVSTAAAVPAAETDAVLAAADCNALMAASQPVFIDLFQGLIDEASSLDKAALAAIADKASDSALITTFLARAERDLTTLEQRGNELGCTQGQARSAVCGAVAELDAQGSVLADTILADMTGECP
jgi:hypothetical protein